MSYTSISEFPASTKLAQVQEIIDLLGYQKVARPYRTPDHVAGYFWYEVDEYRSHVGVELDIHRNEAGKLYVHTRSRAGRSYWDLVQQNRTLKILRDQFGAKFSTDAGRNQYWRPDGPAPTPLASGCYIARWRLNNGLMKAHSYLSTRKLEGQIAPHRASEFSFMDDLNPRLLSNNMLLPFAVAVWEEYFRSTFAACLRYSPNRDITIKTIRVEFGDLDAILRAGEPLERVVAEQYSFQRPSGIARNFRMLDKKIDLAGAMRRPYRRRKRSLFDTIEEIVEDRNSFVHTGHMNLKLFDKQIKVVLSDMETAASRCYSYLAKHFCFVPSDDF